MVLEVKNLSVSFSGKKALSGINFHLKKGEVLGIVGESGSGKSLTSMAIMGLLPSNATIESGEIILHTKDGAFDLLKLSQKELRNFRGNEIGMIFQEPMTSLNPSICCGEQVEEVIRLHKKLKHAEAKSKVITLFDKVQLPNPERIYNAYPHELSGGQKQRVMIAMAISCQPMLLIADEPTTALDVTVQKTILELLKKIQQDEGMSILFISHDLGVIAEVAQQVLVMYRGEIVEQSNVLAIFNHPKEQYTRGLLACKPRLDVRLRKLPTVNDFVNETDFVSEVYTTNERKKFQTKIYETPPILEVKNLSKYFSSSNSFFGKNKNDIKAVDDISFKVFEGETLGLVGESGSGKTTLSRTILMLDRPTSGQIFYKGEDITRLSSERLRRLRKEIQIIFQDPYSSLNPRANILQILTEPMALHNIGNNKAERIQKALEVLERVGLTAQDLNKYPHEFSGGQRQRIGIARAIALNPKFIICDESVSALDVSVQAQILNLLNELKQVYGFTYIFISHDLAVVKYMSNQLLVMSKGKIEEIGDADDIYANPKCVYTQKLINSIPKITG